MITRRRRRRYVLLAILAAICLAAGSMMCELEPSASEESQRGRELLGEEYSQPTEKGCPVDLIEAGVGGDVIALKTERLSNEIHENNAVDLPALSQASEDVRLHLRAQQELSAAEPSEQEALLGTIAESEEEDEWSEEYYEDWSDDWYYEEEDWSENDGEDDWYEEDSEDESCDSEEESDCDDDEDSVSAGSGETSSSASAAGSGSYSDLDYLAAICQIEAGDNYEGALAVANVVLNRLNNGYAGSIYGVIYAPYQFATGSMDYYLQNGTSSAARQGAADALAGVNNVGSYLHFNGIYWLDPATLSVPYTVIGGNVFY